MAFRLVVSMKFMQEISTHKKYSRVSNSLLSCRLIKTQLFWHYFQDVLPFLDT